MQEKCFFGDMENPVADVAAQASTALALISRVLMRYGNPQEQALAGKISYYGLCAGQALA